MTATGAPSRATWASESPRPTWRPTRPDRLATHLVSRYRSDSGFVGDETAYRENRAGFGFRWTPRILARVLARTLRQGWHCSIRRKVDLTAVDVGAGVFKITVPTNAFNIRTDDKDAWRPVTEVSGFLFDLFNGANTDDWGSAEVIRVRYSLELSLSQMPQYLADYVIASAARHFNDENVDPKHRNRSRLRTLRSDERDLRAAARQADLRESRMNVNESDHARRIMGERQGTAAAGIVPSS